MRLIDADELRKRMYHEAFETDTDMQRWDSGCWIRYKMFENAIESTPTIDTKKELICSVTVDTDEIIERIKELGWEPVKHGRWIMHPNGHGTCSNCKKCSLDIMGGVDSNYCPNCGAKMDGDKNG